MTQEVPEHGTPPGVAFVGIRDLWTEERYLRRLQTIGRLMTAVELLLNASKAEGFDGNTQRAEDLKGSAQDLIETAQQIASDGETKR